MGPESDLNPRACQVSGTLPSCSICMLNVHVKSVGVVTTACGARSLKNLLQSCRQDSGLFDLINLREEENGTDLMRRKQNLQRQWILLDERKRCQNDPKCS